MSEKNLILNNLDKTMANRKKTIASGEESGKSYVEGLYKKGADAFLKKVGEEASEFVMAAKDLDYLKTDKAREKLISEAADLWFHSIVSLGYFGLTTDDVLNELARREGLGGLVEKAHREK